jgi:hypothetical protein
MLYKSIYVQEQRVSDLQELGAQATVGSSASCCNTVFGATTDGRE